MFASYSTSLVLLILSVFQDAAAIRTLKEGAMIDEEGREYKLAPLAEYIRAKLPETPTVRVECTEGSMVVFIQPDFFRNGRLVSAKDLFLGDDKHSKSSQCQAVDAGDDGYVIEVGLNECGSKLTIADDDIIYSNKLIYSPTLNHHSITRTTEAEVPISCHYKRTHTVSSNAQHQPLTFSKQAKFSAANSAFTLKLMTKDWSREVFSSTFHLGDLLHLEASYVGPDQRRIFIDSCVATLTPDPTSVPRHYFIENHGCFTDSKGGSMARFLPRWRADSLQFQLDAFLFRNDLRNTVFITCGLKAVPKMWKNSPTNKACNYIHSRWNNVDGNDGVCQCCDRFCDERQHMDMVCDVVTIGPLIIFPRM